jgi:hypothetical protein
MGSEASSNSTIGGYHKGGIELPSCVTVTPTDSRARILPRSSRNSETARLLWSGCPHLAKVCSRLPSLVAMGRSIA